MTLSSTSSEVSGGLHSYSSRYNDNFFVIVVQIFEET